VSTQEPNRDQAVEALLRQQLRSGPVSASSDRCLDAETLAAWIDGDLRAADIATAEAHVATCARCQTMIAALVRATPAVPRPAPWWRRGWVLGSLVPLTAGAMAIAIWIARPEAPDRVAVQMDAPQPSVAPLPKESSPAPPSAPSARVAPQDSAATFVPPMTPQPLRDRASAPPTFGAQSSAANRERAENKDEPTAGPRRDQELATPASGAVGAAPAFRAPAAPPAAAAEAASPRSAVMADQALLKHSVTSIEVLSPNPSIRWRIGASGSIERSGNGGATWTASSSGVTADLLAGAAPSPTVCWIVGRAGTVLLSADGLQWQRLAFPERADLTVVQATDAVNATVTAADNRKFRTADGGQTWTLLQEF